MSYQYTAQFMSRRNQSWSRNQNTTKFTPSVKLGPVSHTVLIAIMVATLGIIYLTQATKSTSYDYEAQKIDAQISDLKTKKIDLEIENARLTALENIKNTVVAKEMNQPGSVNYVP